MHANRPHLRFRSLSLVTKILSLLPFTLAFQAFGENEKPNILWIVTEDNSHHWIGAYGDPLARTPHIDSLAKQGNLYKYGYSNAPVCAVARSTLITGMYSCSTGTHNMRSRYPIPEDVIKPYVYYMKEAGYFCTNKSKTDYNISFKDKKDDEWWDGNKNSTFKDCPPGQPFFSIINLTTSHESNLFDGKIQGHIKSGNIPETPKTPLDKIKLPPYLPEREEILTDWARYYDIMEYTDSLIGNIIKDLKASGKADNTIIFHYADHGGILPRAKRFIHDTGTHVPWVVYFPKKWQHLAQAQPGQAVDEPVSFVDLAPTILSLADVQAPANMQGRAFLGKHREEPKDNYVFLFGQRFDGTYFRFSRGITDGEWRYMRNFHNHRPCYMQTGYAYGQAGWRALLDAWKNGELNELQASYYEAPQPVEELYHTAMDPWEVKNLANDPRHKEKLNELRNAMLSKMKAIRDTGIVPETMYEIYSENGTIFNSVQDERFDYAAALDMAVKASSKNPKNLKELKAALKDSDPVIRHWGAMGCMLLGKKGKSALSELKPLLKDENEAVRLTAARAYAELGDRQAGAVIISDLFRNSAHTVVKERAFQSLDELDAVPDDIIQSSVKQPGYVSRMIADYRRRNGIDSKKGETSGNEERKSKKKKRKETK